jgi:hypothetical protein
MVNTCQIKPLTASAQPARANPRQEAGGIVPIPSNWVYLAISLFLAPLPLGGFALTDERLDYFFALGVLVE